MKNKNFFFLFFFFDHPNEHVLTSLSISAVSCLLRVTAA